LLALLVAAVLVPEAADVVLSIEDVSGLRALLEKAGTHAPSLAPEPIGATLRDRVGIDLLAESPAWGLAQRGARMLSFSRRTIGLSAPLRDGNAAKKMLSAWLAQNPRRAGRIAGSRLLTASGPEAAPLLAAMVRPAAVPRELAAQAKGALWLWARLAEPLRAAVLSIEASGTGVVARGVVTAQGAILAGKAPAGCEAGIACLRVGLGPAGRAALAHALEHLGIPSQPELQAAARVQERLEAIEVRELTDSHSLPRALRVAPLFDGPQAAATALEGRIDLAGIDAALATLTPLDALRGAIAATAYAVHLLYGRLLHNAGPLTFIGNPQRGGSAAIEVRLPLR
jgi:hypothetical protein